MNAFAHIPSAVMSAVNAVGVAHHTLDAAYAVIREAFIADKLSAEDGKTLLAMSLNAHLPRKYAGQITALGVTRNSALYMQVRRIWAKEIDIKVAETAVVKVSAAEKAAYEEMVAAIAEANAAFALACGKRAGAVRKTMAARAKAAK